MDTAFIQIIEKVRLSECLNAEEMEALARCPELLETRLQIHELDRWWAAEVARHFLVVRRRGRTTYHLPQAAMPATSLVLGIGLILGAVGSLLSRGAGGPQTPLPVVLAGLGVFVLLRAWRGKRGWDAYHAARSTYLCLREAALARLPAELRPASRVCLHCVSVIT